MRYTTRWVDGLAEGRIGQYPTALVVVALYCAVQIAIMPLLSALAGTGVSHDDAEQLMYMPYLWPGYGGSQPPLFSWLGWATAALVGPNILALKVLKYVLIFAAMATTYVTVRKLGYSQRAASASMFGLMLFPQLFWEMQRQLSHSIASLCFCALLIAALFALLRRQAPTDYLLFGLVAALAILSKYNNLILLGALLAACLSLRETRSAILSPKLALSAVVAILALAPTLYWSASHPAEVMARSSKFGIDPQANAFLTALKGSLELANSVINFAVLPVAVIAVALAVTRLMPFRKQLDITEKLLWRAMACGIAITLVLVLASGTTRLSDRWLLPVLFFLPMTVAIGLDSFGTKGRKVQNVLICAGAAFALLVLPATWFIQVAGGRGLARIVQMQYGDLYKALTKDGPVRTAVSDWHWIGNLRLVDPDIVAINDEVPEFGKLIEQPAILVWLDREQPPHHIIDALAKAGYQPSGEAETTAVPELLDKTGSGRTVRFVRLDALSPTALQRPGATSSTVPARINVEPPFDPSGEKMRD